MSLGPELIRTVLPGVKKLPKFKLKSERSVSASSNYTRVKTLTLENVSKSVFKPFHWDRCDPKHRNKLTDLELENISNWAFSAEKIFHGTPSGKLNTV